MCRLLGIIASDLTEFGLVLTEAPRCLATLSREHPDGWGIAIHDASASTSLGEQTWQAHKGTPAAREDRRFYEIAARSRGHVLISHVRQKTVGPTRLENTHPFVRSGWVFAHNGTIQAQDALRARCSRRRLRELRGETDSELLFAYLLTRLDEQGLVHLDSERTRTRAAELMNEVTTALRAERVGAFNFLLSDGQTTFAHRFGRSLFVLERGPSDPVRELRELDRGATLMTRWMPRRQAVFIASERITDEPWREIADCTLLRIERMPTPRIVVARAAASRLAAS